MDWDGKGGHKPTYCSPKCLRAAKHARERLRRREAASKPPVPVEPRPAPQKIDPRPLPAPKPYPDDPAGAMSAWAAERLVVPPGHYRNSGKPLVLPSVFVDFFRAAEGCRESALSMARKGGKSAAAAVWALSRLDESSPLHRPGWRGAVASVSKYKSAELLRQIREIALASGLQTAHRSGLSGLFFRKAPYPGSVETPHATLDILSADVTAGHASGFDEVFVDETGLLPERSRELLAGLRSSVSARDGRMMHWSVRGNSPLFDEILANPEVHSVVWAAEEGCDPNDPAAWRAANPTLGIIKSEEYMRDEAKRVAGSPGDLASFLCWDLNQRLEPSQEMIFAPSALELCIVDEPPPREGPCVVGVDIGSSTSLTAAVAVWPANGRTEMWLACGSQPSLEKRSERDNANYRAMVHAGELTVHEGRTVSVDRFIGDVARDLSGCEVEALAGDGWKDAEVRDACDRAGIDWPLSFRRVGAGKSGSEDVRAAVRLVLEERLRFKRHLGLATAIRHSRIRYDANGNPGLDKSGTNARIDILSAFIIACGLAAPRFDRPADDGFAVFAV